MLALSDSPIDEVLSADVIWLGIPMHNFSIPATFKAWTYQIARAGKTFSYADQGRKGLIPSDKKVIAILTRGGIYAGDGPAGSSRFPDFLPSPDLGLIGRTDVTFIHADRQGMGGQAAQLAMEKAMRHVASLFSAGGVRNAAERVRRNSPKTNHPSLA